MDMLSSKSYQAMGGGAAADLGMGDQTVEQQLISEEQRKKKLQVMGSLDPAGSMRASQSLLGPL